MSQLQSQRQNVSKSTFIPFSGTVRHFETQSPWSTGAGCVLCSIDWVSKCLAVPENWMNNEYRFGCDKEFLRWL